MRDFDFDKFESALSLESDEEFGVPNLHGGISENNNSLVLSTWSAQDFSNLFVELRPHLERHARRYVSSPFLCEEIVQEAFLYLLSTLPEIDNRDGVLRFLKWKVKMLALDSYRWAYARRERTVPEIIDAQTADDDLSEELERAEDNAVIRMALSKLSPRHRNVLLSNVYEEKSAEEIGAEFGLSANSARQLIFRARRAFRHALVGEAEIKGRSMNEVLSIAAKKVANDALQNSGKIGMFLVVGALGLGSLQLFAPMIATDESNPNFIADATPLPPTISEESPQPEVSGPIDVEKEVIAPVQATTEPFSNVIAQEPEIVETSASQEINAQEEVTTPVESGLILQLADNPDTDRIVSTNVANAGVYTGVRPAFFDDTFTGEVFEVFGGTGISAFVDYQEESRSISNVLFHIWVAGERYAAIARNLNSQVAIDGEGFRLIVEARDFYVVSDSELVFSESPLSGAAASVIVELDAYSNPKFAKLSVSKVGTSPNL